MSIEQPNQIESSPLNNREEAMLKELNEKTNSEYQLTEEGYNEAGRSKGIIEKLIELGGEDEENIKKRFLSISRNK
jgi:hypothetical protein